MVFLMQQVKEHLSLIVMKKSFLLPHKMHRGMEMNQMVERQKIVYAWGMETIWNSLTLNVLMEENIVQFVKHQVINVFYTIDYVYNFYTKSCSTHLFCNNTT